MFWKWQTLWPGKNKKCKYFHAVIDPRGLLNVQDTFQPNPVKSEPVSSCVETEQPNEYLQE